MLSVAKSSGCECSSDGSRTGYRSLLQPTGTAGLKPRRQVCAPACILHRPAVAAYTTRLISQILAEIFNRRSLYEDVDPFGDQNRPVIRGSDSSVRWVGCVSKQRIAAVTTERSRTDRLHPGCSPG